MTAYLEEHVISIPALAMMIEKLIRNAQDLLCSKLVFQYLDYLVSRDPSLYTDNLSCVQNGESFVHLEKNGLQDGHTRVLRFLPDSSLSDQWVRETSDGPQLSEKMISSYMKHVRSFLEILLVLVHLSYGSQLVARSLRV